MIKTFADKQTAALWAGDAVRPFPAIRSAAERRLRALDSATSLDDLGRVPGNRLEKLRDDRRGQFSIRVNDQWRLCFDWAEGHAWNVALVDYH